MIVEIVDRYAPRDLFALVPGLMDDFEPELRELDRLLEDDGIVQTIKADMARRAPRSLTRGRHSTPVEVVLRLLVVKRLYGWSYAEVEHFVGDSLVLRQFCRVYLEPVPDATTLLRWAHLIGPATLGRLNDRVVELARSLKVTRGRKLRVDSAVVETTIHHPTDSRLLGDGVRVLSRLLRRAREVLGGAGQGVAPARVWRRPGCGAGQGVALGALGPAALRSRTRSVRRLAQTLHRVARRKGEAAAEDLREAYRKLLAVAAASRAHGEAARDALRAPADDRSRRLAERFAHFLPLVARALAQARRRVLDGETVPAPEKLLSLFEPHTQVIVRHKPGKPAEFGRKLWLEEVDGGIVSGYRLLPAAGQDDAYLPESLAAHRRRFGRPPWLVAGDRGVASPSNERLATQAGVRRVVRPARGRASPARAQHERQPWFRRGFRFRAGIEGRISVLRRRFGLARCPDHGEPGMGRWVGWGIVAHNLAKIAQTQAVRAARAA